MNPKKIKTLMMYVCPFIDNKMSVLVGVNISCRTVALLS